MDQTPDDLALFVEHVKGIGKLVRRGNMVVDTGSNLIRKYAEKNGIGPPGAVEDMIRDELEPVDEDEPGPVDNFNAFDQTIEPPKTNGHDTDPDPVAATGAEATSAPSLPVIQIKAGELSLLATMAEELLIEAGVSIYQRSGRLVRPIIETVDATHDRKTKIAQLKALDAVYMRDLLCRHARWQKWDARAKQLVPINPPSEIPATMLARAGEWTFPAITGVISAPTMRPNGSLLLEAGYDEATRLLLIEQPPMSPVPDRPTRKDAEAALKLIEDLLTGFPFIDDVARAVALSSIITPVVRGAFPVTPLHASRAPTAGTGKSFLFDWHTKPFAAEKNRPTPPTGGRQPDLDRRRGHRAGWLGISRGPAPFQRLGCSAGPCGAR